MDKYFIFCLNFNKLLKYITNEPIEIKINYPIQINKLKDFLTLIKIQSKKTI
jgi:hypothetical protein